MLEKDPAFHPSGHVLHSLFWTNLSPDGGGDPAGELGAAFGSVDVLAQADFGGGGHYPVGTIPRLAIDASEHAYYLQYLNAKGDFLDAMGQVLNWADVAERLVAARPLDT